MTQEQDDILEEEIESWSSFSEILRENDKVLFTQMLNEVKEYKDAINSKGDLFTVESMFMMIIFLQQKMIKELMSHYHLID